MLGFTPRIASDTALQLFPSPAKVSTEIQIKTGLVRGELAVYDIQGKVVLSQPFDTSQIGLIQFKAPSSIGAYFLRLNGGGTTQEAKFIVY